MRHFISIVKEDTRRWASSSILYNYLTQPNYRLIFRFRLCQFLRAMGGAFLPLYYLECYLFHRLCRKCGCDIPSHVKIGGGFVIPHTWGVVLNSKSIIGSNATILSGVVLGKGKNGAPIVGDNVYIGAGAILIGNIKIGDNVTIGAGSVVVKDVPDNVTVVGNPAKIIKYNDPINE